MTKDRSASCVRVRASRYQESSERLFWRDAKSPSRTGIERETLAQPKRRHDATYGRQSIPDSGFVIPSSFVIRISSFLFHASKLPNKGEAGKVPTSR